MANDFRINVVRDKQRLTAKFALRRASRILLLLKAGRKFNKWEFDRYCEKFEIYNKIFEDAVKQEGEIYEEIRKENEKG